MVRCFAVSAMVVALAPFQWSARPVPQEMKTQLKQRGFWKKGCPVGLGDLRLLTVSHLGFDGEAHRGELIVNKTATGPMSSAFRTMYRNRFPIRHMRFEDFYGPKAQRPDDVTASFECRQAVPSPCTGGKRTGTWSMHAYGLAIDINPRENPYVGCGQSNDPTARSYRDRRRQRPGMIGGRTVRAFTASGWGWGGAWAGDTKDYMHFSSNGR
jgi:D-alanyl-D-alanine carboxypeptidase-like protein